MNKLVAYNFISAQWRSKLDNSGGGGTYSYSSS